jgi:hypothetical protein
MLSSIRGAIDKIANQQRANSQSKSNLAGYQQSLLRMLADMRLDPHEISALKNQQQGLALDSKTVYEIHCDMVSRVIDHIFADGMVTQEELNALSQISSALGVHTAHLPPDKLHRIQMASTVLSIQNGNLPSISPNQSAIRLVAGEILHAQIPCQILDERSYRQTVGGSSSVSFRIMKGVSYRVGSSRSRSYPVTHIVPVDQGTFIVTSKRLAYVGVRQSFNFEWGKIIGIDPMADGLMIASTSRKKTSLVKYGSSAYNEIIESVIMYYL